MTMNAPNTTPATSSTPITLLVCALGGEGGGVLTDWLVEAARIAGYPAQATSIPGVAQRTGATTYYIEVFPQSQAALGGRRPVFSLSPVPGMIDVLVSSELLETARQVSTGMCSAQRTCVITSSARTFTTTERMALGDGRVDEQRLAALVRQHSREHHLFDMSEMARTHGTVVSAVMLGALAASGRLPFGREACEQAVRGALTAGQQPTGATAASLHGFAAAFDAVHAPRQQAAAVAALLDDGHSVAPRASAQAATLPAVLAAQFPPVVHDMLELGHARVLEYHDEAYAQRYVHRLHEVLLAERQADPPALHGHAVTREMARWLALWMAFDDIVRVADLKSRASRWQRVRGEVKAGDGDLLRLYDHFKPGVPEFAGLLPQALASRLLAWDAARVRRGLAPWSMPLKVGTHSVAGLLMLRLLASMKWLRAQGSRYATEQAMIDRWLAAVVAGTQRDWRLGHEIALCGRLIKGYGSTNERGKHNLLHVIDHLALLPDAAAAAQAIAAARTAALADEGGRALDEALRQHGAPPRPVAEQPVRWMRRPPGIPAATAQATKGQSA